MLVVYDARRALLSTATRCLVLRMYNFREYNCFAYTFAVLQLIHEKHIYTVEELIGVLVQCSHITKKKHTHQNIHKRQNLLLTSIGRVKCSIIVHERMNYEISATGLI